MILGLFRIDLVLSVGYELYWYISFSAFISAWKIEILPVRHVGNPICLQNLQDLVKSSNLLIENDRIAQGVPSKKFDPLQSLSNSLVRNMAMQLPCLPVGTNNEHLLADAGRELLHFRNQIVVTFIETVKRADGDKQPLNHDYFLVNSPRTK